MKFQYIADYRGSLTRSHLCRLMGVTERGLYAWKHRPPSHRPRRDMVLLAHIRDQHRLSLGSYGRPRMADFIRAYNFGRRLKTLKGLTPYEFICKCWTSEPERFILNPLHQMPGLNILAAYFHWRKLYVGLLPTVPRPSIQPPSTAAASTQTVRPATKAYIAHKAAFERP